MADILGAIGEIAVPILLLFSVNRTLTVVGVVSRDLLPPVHHFHLPAGRAAGMESAVHLHLDHPVRGIPHR